MPPGSRFCPGCGAPIASPVGAGPEPSDATLDAGASVLATDETASPDDSHDP
ncbi:MAG: hypothetical protein D6744_11130, partial [Planctomycetota bacterium]